MNSEHKAVMDIFAELSRKSRYALESFMSNDLDKAGVRLEQVENLLNKAKSEFSNYCMLQGDANE